MIYLYLAVAVLVFGLGVVVVSRRNAARGTTNPPVTSGRSALPPRPPAVPSAPPKSAPVPTAEPIESIDPGVALSSEAHDDAETEDEAAPVTDVAPAAIPEAVEKPSVRARLARARGALAGTLLGVRNRGGITNETWDELEEALLRADVGVRVTDELLSGLRAGVKAKTITTPDELLAALQAEMTSRLSGANRSLSFVPATDDATGPNVWLFVGVNGVGKTTTIGKVGAQQAAEGRTVLMAAGDTFRAAAAEQLGMWAERSGAELVRGAEGGDPSAVIFDSIERANARKIELVLADTAGRLHTKSNLMDELRKVRRVASKGQGRVTEVLLVIDATTGQNGLTQAREFGAATAVGSAASSGEESGITGVVLTKLDGSAKGGIVFAIETELGIPVKLVGLGEGIGDLVAFDPAEFIDALFASD
jgi:fused signal recognition particle receptor